MNYKSLALLVVFCLLSLSKTFSQVNLSDKIQQHKKANGTKLIYQEGDSIKIYASFKNNKMSELFATNKNGQKYDLVYDRTGDEGATKKGTIKSEPIECVVCVRTEDGKLHNCYVIKCNDMPPPKKAD